MSRALTLTTADAGDARCCATLPAAGSATTRPLACALALCSLASTAMAGDVVGYRGDGTGHFPGEAPTRWGPEAACWNTSRASWSNATMVLADGSLCGLSEPSDVWCLDAATGAERWRRTMDATMGLDDATRATVEADRSAATGAAERLVHARREYSQLRRRLRGGDPDGAVAEALRAADAKMAELAKLLDRVAPYATGGDREIVGYTTHSPVSDGDRLHVLLGHGLLAALDLDDGTVQWAQWLGPVPAPMRGYHLGTSASLVLADGIVIVPHGVLRGYDAATGELRWTSEVVVRDFGSPSLITVDGVSIALLPTGEAVRIRDGRTVAEGLGDTWFVGPAVHDDTAVWLGAQAVDGSGSVLRGTATAVRLSWAGPDTLAATPRWSLTIPGGKRIFSPGVYEDGAWWAIDESSDVWRIDDADGALTQVADFTFGPGYPAIAAIGGQLLVGGEEGGFAVLAPSASGADRLASFELSRIRSSPIAQDGRAYFRTLDGVWCMGAP